MSDGKHNFDFKFISRLESDPSKSVKVELDATFNTAYEHFNYDCDMSPSSMARDVARESWTEEYFKTLQKLEILSIKDITAPLLRQSFISVDWCCRYKLYQKQCCH